MLNLVDMVWLWWTSILTVNSSTLKVGYEESYQNCRKSKNVKSKFWWTLLKSPCDIQNNIFYYILLHILVIDCYPVLLCLFHCRFLSLDRIKTNSKLPFLVWLLLRRLLLSPMVPILLRLFRRDYWVRLRGLSLKQIYPKQPQINLFHHLRPKVVVVVVGNLQSRQTKTPRSLPTRAALACFTI